MSVTNDELREIAVPVPGFPWFKIAVLLGLLCIFARIDNATTAQTADLQADIRRVERTLSALEAFAAGQIVGALADEIRSSCNAPNV
jgi:hypothetical protein